MNLMFSHLLCALAPIGAVNTPTSAGEQVRLFFAPTEGSKLEKVWTSEHALVVGEMNRSRGEESQPYRMKSNGVGSEEVVGAIDEYLSVGEGPVRKFRRLYHKGRRTSQLVQTGDGTSSSVGPKIRQKCELRGASIVFTWVPEEGGYGKYFDARDVNEEYLPYLRSDLDLTFALPSGPVEPGARWSLLPEALIDLFGRGGTLPFEEVGGKDDFLIRALDSGVAGGLEQAFGGDAEGAVEVEFTEVREVDGRRLAVLALTCEVSYERDRTQFVLENSLRQERKEGIEYLEAFLKLEVTGAAEILWDIDGHRPAGLTFQGREKVYARVAHHAPMDDEGVDRSQDVTLEGGLEIRATYTTR